MARVRSVDFLPEIFRTDANKQFLAATLDTLIQEPRYKKTQGFIGRTVGPGVNPNDKYVIEPNKVRADYQLEPGVVSLDPRNTTRIKDALTWPGLLDAVTMQGGVGTRPDRLTKSDYYTWDPFCDFDAFVNFSQYYWLPSGPDAVDVQSTGVPASADFTVTRENGVYTFSSLSGANPQIQLLRGGSYTFRVAQNAKETVNYRVANEGTTAYIIDGRANPTLTLARGNTYVFNVTLRGGAYPFWIKTAPSLGTTDVYDQGVSRNGAIEGLVTFVVPQDAPDVLYYAAQNQSNMQGTFNIVDGVTGTGPGFWIQTTPGISGVVPSTPNISNRDVLGVTNNGEDLGTIVFNVPDQTAQQFYYDLPELVQPVDLVTSLSFSDIDGQALNTFVASRGGIDGISSLQNRTLVFVGDTPGLPVDQARQLYQINYVTVDNVQYLSVVKITDIPISYKFTVRYGNVYSNTMWYKTTLGELKQVPLLTAVQDTLYYQDGTDPEIFGVIKLLDDTQAETLFIDNILGKKSYVSPNGVVFTNGLKVVFQGDVLPASYGSGTVPVEATSTSISNNAIGTFSTGDLYVGQEIVFDSPTLGGLEAGVSYYVHSIINDFQFTVAAAPGANAVNLQNGSGIMTGNAINYREYYVSGVGTSIDLLPVPDFVLPETYTNNDSEPDYITIDRAGLDRNAWSRSNRWFHIDVINSTASYNGTVPELDPNRKAKRPIIQFRPGLRLYNMGTEGKHPVDVIDFTETDVFSNIEGATSYSVDGYEFVNGTRVIFAADEDPEVRNKIWNVEFVTPDTIPPLIAQPIINLTLASDGEVLVDQSTVVLNSGTDIAPVPAESAGKTYWYDGINWILAQQKTTVQQPPLFDVYDSDQVSFGNQSKYPSSNFVGSKLFGYAVGDSGILDPVLKFPLEYLSIANVGDIVFDNNLYVDTFVYTRDNVSTTESISIGTPREYHSRTQYQLLLGWQNAVTTTKVYQQFKFTYSGDTLALDVAASPQTDVPSIKIYVGAQFQDPSTYSYLVGPDSTTITLKKTYLPTDIIEVLVLSDQTSRVAFYQVPVNLENNPLNENSERFTLGTIRQHYQSICENLSDLTGSISGANNTRDLGNIVPYGLTILQQSAPLTLAGYFLRSEKYNIFSSILYNAREYNKFKNQILEAVTQQTIGFQSAAEILDTAIESVTLGRVENQPFYWSDMLPSGAVYTQTQYTISFITTDTFDTRQVYDYTTANYLGMNVYLNSNILTRGLDYVVATDGPRITILVPLAVGDVVTLREFSTTVGSFCPNTPTKLGLYPAWEPRVEIQRSTNGQETVLIGHDGSATKLFGDIRDDVLLELERRIYNNLKLDGNPVPLTVADVLPGQFRKTGFDLQEIQNVLNTDFLYYVASNKLDFKTQQYSVSNEFSYNYDTATNRLDNSTLPGSWRGVNRYFYDTLQPQYTPWEMLGFTIKPDWWDNTYGQAPYTAGNMVLWDDLAEGLVRDPLGAYVVPEYARPQLTEVIPTDDQGDLLPPLDTVVGNYNASQFQRNWQLGDGGPVEASWWNSSLYPFAVMHLLAVTRPAKFFSLFADRDRYRYNQDFDQYLYDNRYRLDANGVEVYGNGVSKASFINWIVDYNRVTGLDTTQELTADLQNLDVRLCYRMSSFSDKQYIKIYTEKATPDSTNTSFLIPDESYSLLLYKNQPFARVNYSAVMVQRVSGGFQVFGYSTTQPYFETQQSQLSGQLRTLTVAGVTVRVPILFTSRTTQVPYGTIFTNETEVSDFLLSYGQYLLNQGLVFDNRENGYSMDWNQMVVEFLYWSQQGWDENAIISLNPLAQRLQITRPQAIVDSLEAQTAENLVLDQNRRELPTRNLNIVRIDNTIKIEPLTSQSVSYVDLRYTAYEHMIVLDNRSVFGDLVYDPVTGARQSRLNLVATTSTEWNGSVDPQGFILNQDNVQDWTGTRVYSKGEIVLYKGSYWSAATIVQPSESFNYNDWLQSDYEPSEVGLLPNLANKSDQLQKTYDINQANLETEEDLFSYGLIGFRPRRYLAALNLDDVSQVNVYRQFLNDKGTLLSAELLRQTDLGKETADYKIYENWAVQRATYGANANRSFFELRLNSSLLNSNPSIIQVINPQQPSVADQRIPLSTVWRQSYKLTSPNILPVTASTPTDTALPTAGYVSLDDADVTIFDINQDGALDSVLDQINVGTTIWTAKINSYDWNIYRAESVPGTISHVCDNLDQTSLVIFTEPHGLTVGDTVIVRFFDTEVDGAYRVLTVPSINKITIAFVFARPRTVINGTGLAFTLQTMRVSQPSDVVNLPYANGLFPGSRVWADINGNGLWAVYQKQDVYSPVTTLAPKLLDATEGYGQAVALTTDQTAAFVGSPRYGFTNSNETGGVYVYVRSSTSTYQPISPEQSTDAILTLDVTGTREYGSSLAVGNQEWAVSGAPGSLGSASQSDYGYACVIYQDPAGYLPGTNPYYNWQLLTPPLDPAVSQGRFGSAVAMSQDERWLYVTAPAVNGVYAYARVEWQNQFLRAAGDGITDTYDISQVIAINAGTQILVTIDGTEQVLNVDYTVSPGFDSVTFLVAPAVDSDVLIQRLSLRNWPGSTASINLDDYFYQVSLSGSSIESFSVEVNSVLQRPGIDYTFDSVTKVVTFVTVYDPSDTILIRAKSYFKFVSSLVVPGMSPTDAVGTSVSVTTDGRQVMVGAPFSTVDGKARAGSIYVFDRNVQRFFSNNLGVYVLAGPPPDPMSVSVQINGVFLTHQDLAAPGAANTFAIVGNTVTCNATTGVGDFVDIGTNLFALIQEVKQQSAEIESDYGAAVDLCSNNCSLYVGAPGSNLQIYKGGIVERAVNQSRLYGTITSVNSGPTLVPGHTLRVNDQDVAVPAPQGPISSLEGLANNISDQVPNVTAFVSNGFLLLSVTNSEAALSTNKLRVAPGSIGTAFWDLGFDTFIYAQTIKSPFPTTGAGFGSSLSISDSVVDLVIGAPAGSTYLLTLFDDDITEFDVGATTFVSITFQSGAAYIYNRLPAANPSATNPDQFVLGQQIAIKNTEYLDRVGFALDYSAGLLWIGAPGSDIGDSSSADYGQVHVWQNATRSPAWFPIRVQQPTVDVRLLNSVFLYNLSTNSTTEFLDFINPLQGKILGAARQNIDYIGAVDPASYNVGPNNIRGSNWAATHVGEVWWDISTVRFVNPEQNNLSYAARRWAQVFPGSRVDVYQWIASSQPPANYTGPGTPLNTVSYTINTVLASDGTFQTQYFFWVRGLTTMATQKGKTLSVSTVSQYIENPRASGIAFMAPLTASALAIYNCETLLEAFDTVLHVEFDREIATDNSVHVEYELVPQGRADGFISDNLYRKLQDSFCGVDTAGNLVPDITLSPPERFGVQFRPRQSMFVDRFLALKSYIQRTNQVLLRYPIVEIRPFVLLNSQEPPPPATETVEGNTVTNWNFKVVNLEELGFQNIDNVVLGYRYLVESDSSQRGRWSIYQVVESESQTNQRDLLLVRVQNYFTPDYWSYVDWYQPGYNNSIKPVLEVANFANLSTISVPVGSSVKVTSNAQGKFEIYLRTLGGWERVGLEDGTIEIAAELYDYALGRFGFDVEVFDAQYFDQEPVIETRKIIQAINQELFVDDLLIERNNLLILMFNYILSESAAPEWLVKTSLVDVDHRIRELAQFQNYNRDNQEFVIDYLQEVKPYHVQVREFNLEYFGNDSYPGDATDFDVPAYFNTGLTIPQYTSPVLLPYRAGLAQVSNTLSDTPASSAVWKSWPWSQWYNNFLMTLDSIYVVSGGTGYTEAPQVTVQGDAVIPATVEAKINSSGEISEVVVLNPGSGYRDQPTIVFLGGNGTGARAYARLINGLVREFKTTIKYDRYQYQTQVLTWSPEGIYENGTLVRYDNRVWRAQNADGSSANVGPTFDLENWIEVPASELSGVDRTMGFYVAGVDAPGLELPLLVDGVSYPGVQVWGDYFTGTEELDAEYRSSFGDLFLGTRPTDINVEGGQFIGAYEGHAPEELVNGSEFDTMDIKVYTRPGSDWQRDGHGFEIAARNVQFDAVLANTFFWGDLVEYPAQILLSNVTTGRDLAPGINYNINWVDQTVTILLTAGVSDNDIVNISVYEVGGGSQLYRAYFVGNTIADGVFDVPVSTAEIETILILVDGESVAVPSWQPYIDSQTWNIAQSYSMNTVVNTGGIYYRSIAAVPVGIDITNTAYWVSFVPTLQSRVTMVAPPPPTAGVSVIVFGISTVNSGDFIIGREYTILEPGDTDWIGVGAASSQVGQVFVATGVGDGNGKATTLYSWSTPQTQYVVANSLVVNNFGFALTDSMQGTNPANIVVTRNGVRLTPPAGIEWIGDDTSTSFGLPQRLGTSFLQSSINAITDIQVWVDNVLQVQSFGSVLGDYSVTNWDGSNTPGRQVVFNTPPVSGARILISVSTLASYTVSGNQLQLITQPTFGDVYSVISWNDTSQQDILTLVFEGPEVTGITIEEPYDSTDFDAGTVSFGPGSFDYAAGSTIAKNNFDLQRINIDASRLWVTLDGARLYEGKDYTVSGSELVLSLGSIGPTQILTVTEFTNSIVPEASAFRIFQDMRGVQAVYRITESTSTVLTQPLMPSDDIVYVENVLGLTEPVLESGVFGVITIGAERVTYRERNVVNNTVSGLRRGTAGTAVSSHEAGSLVYNMGRGNLLNQGYQDRLISDTTVADGSTTVFYAPSIDASGFDDSSSVWIDSIEVYVGGEKQYRAGEPGTSKYSWIVTDFDPVAIEIFTNDDPVSPQLAPPSGVEVTVLQRRGQWWYDVSTAAARQQSLQENDSLAARFLTGR
jgi:hypothetical protein